MLQSLWKVSSFSNFRDLFLLLKWECFFYINTLIWDVGIFMARRNDFFNENCSLSWNLMILDVKNLSWFNFHQFRKRTSERPPLLLEMAFYLPTCFDAATTYWWLRLHPACCLQCAIFWWSPMSRRICYLVLWTHVIWFVTFFVVKRLEAWQSTVSVKPT